MPRALSHRGGREANLCRRHLGLAPAGVMVWHRQRTRNRAPHNAPMNAELRGNTGDRADTELMLPTELLEQIHFGFPVHKRSPDPIGGTVG